MENLPESLAESLVENFAENLAESLAENLAENHAENLAEMVEGTNLFKKGIDWWKYSIWNGVMGSWPTSTQCSKILQKILGKNLAKILRKWWRGQIYLRKALIGGNIAFVMG